MIFIQVICNQCDQIGRFSELLGKKISDKSSKIFWYLFGLFKITQPSCTNDLATFGAIMGKLGNFLFHHLVTLRNRNLPRRKPFSPIFYFPIQIRRR